MTTDPQIEPVTDEDTRVAMQSYFINMKHILIHDRRRVAERQAARPLEKIDAVERERDALRADLQATREALHEWDNRVGRLQDEVAKLTAACAAKDAALIKARADLREVGNDYPGSSCYEWCHARANEITAALSPDAGRNWIDATGAVEAQASAPSKEGPWLPHVWVPTDWAGSRVLIVRKP